MNSSQGPGKRAALVGLIRIREHCTFSWQEPEGGGRRTVVVRSNHHCAGCVAELRELGYRLVDAGADADEE